MRVSQFTDYSLRVLLYLGLKGEKATISEIAAAFGISNHHLMKVVHRLSVEGYVNSFKGKGGGIELARDASSIRVGEFVQAFEPMDLLECFDSATNTCPIQGVCGLERALYTARAAFVASLNQFTLADFLRSSPDRSLRMKRLGILATPRRARTV